MLCASRPIAPFRASVRNIIAQVTPATAHGGPEKVVHREISFVGETSNSRAQHFQPKSESCQLLFSAICNQTQETIQAAPSPDSNNGTILSCLILGHYEIFVLFGIEEHTHATILCWAAYARCARGPQKTEDFSGAF